jgi:hypothetical protein
MNKSAAPGGRCGKMHVLIEKVAFSAVRKF